jgi:hypothetical protein
MTLQEIKQTISENKEVFWKNENYQVIKDSIGQYLIHSKFNNHYIGLTWMDEVTMNGKEEDFYTI